MRSDFNERFLFHTYVSPQYSSEMHIQILLNEYTHMGTKTLVRDDSFKRLKGNNHLNTYYGCGSRTLGHYCHTVNIC